MDLSKHCELCENQILDINIGTICKLNGKKPTFNKTCSYIDLNDKFKQKLEEINSEYHFLKSSKKVIYFNFYVYLIISILIIALGFSLGIHGVNKGVFATLPFIIGGFGLALLAISFFPIKKYMQHFYVAKSKKEKLDEIVQLYNLRYEFKIQTGKEVHGTKEYYTDLIIERKKN